MCFNLVTITSEREKDCEERKSATKLNLTGIKLLKNDVVLEHLSRFADHQLDAIHVGLSFGSFVLIGITCTSVYSGCLCLCV